MEKGRYSSTQATAVTNHYYGVTDSNLGRCAGSKFTCGVKDRAEKPNQRLRVRDHNPGCNRMPSVRLMLRHVRGLRTAFAQEFTWVLDFRKGSTVMELDRSGNGPKKIEGVPMMKAKKVGLASLAIVLASSSLAFGAAIDVARMERAIDLRVSTGQFMGAVLFAKDGKILTN